MKINWKLRLKNKVTLVALAGFMVTFVYSVLNLLGIVPAIAEGDIKHLLLILIDILVAAGIVSDPTTAGINDSAKALNYDAPKVDTAEDDYIDTEYKGEA